MRSKTKILLIFLLLVLAGIAVYPTPELWPIRNVDRPTGDIRTIRYPGKGAGLAVS